MNLYLRFFNDEILVENADQAINFLSQLSDIKLDEALCSELVRYVESNNPFPKRFKVSPRAYFIVIKTTATTMDEFKAYAAAGGDGTEEHIETEKEVVSRTLATENPGWYHATMKFKRVLAVEGTSKFQYVDTEFEAKLKAHSQQDCYNRVVDHLRNRSDIDPRSQFPSVRGRNFKAEFLGQ